MRRLRFPAVLAVSVSLRALSCATCMTVFFILVHSPSSCTRDTLVSATPHVLPIQGARFTTLSKALRSPRSHYLLRLLPRLALATRFIVVFPARRFLLGLLKET
jgi:hypothetical protein